MLNVGLLRRKFDVSIKYTPMPDVFNHICLRSANFKRQDTLTLGRDIVELVNTDINKHKYAVSEFIKKK